jgi:DNA-directed RNA polymerase subunit M/transcription elongation factor TFIIS
MEKSGVFNHITKLIIMLKNVYCDKCGTIMKQKECESSFGISANLLTCPKCAYQYETGLRYNPYIQDYVKYYKYI